MKYNVMIIEINFGIYSAGIMDKFDVIFTILRASTPRAVV